MLGDLTPVFPVRSASLAAHKTRWTVTVLVGNWLGNA